MADHTATRRTLLAGGVAGSALGGLILASDAEGAVTIPTQPSVDFFVDLTGLPGESLDSQFPDTFDTLDWSFGETTSVGPTNTGGGVGKVKPQSLVFVKRIDKASPHLFLACATGKHFPRAVVICRKQSQRQPFLTITVKDVFVSGYRASPSSSDAVPLDVVSLDFASLTVTYSAQNPDGGLGETITAGFDYVKNKVL